MDVLSIIEKANGRALSQRKRGNARSVDAALKQFGLQLGLDQPHRLAHYLAQLAHESAGFQHDKEIWGPTAAQRRYEGRRDLGNVQKGDGKRFMGRTGIQITGRGNVRRFTSWVRKIIDANAPDFEKEPEKLNTDPWEGLAPIWYWSEGNPTGGSLNRFADQNDIEMVTRRINGGLNGYADRLHWYDRFALVMLGHAHNGISEFQSANKLTVDGISGPKTRAAMHCALVKQSSVVSDDVASAPVVEEKPKPVVPQKVDDAIKKPTTMWQWLTTIFGGGGAGGAFLFGMEWQTVAVIAGATIALLILLLVFRNQVIGAVRDIRREVEA